MKFLLILHQISCFDFIYQGHNGLVAAGYLLGAGGGGSGGKIKTVCVLEKRHVIGKTKQKFAYLRRGYLDDCF